jgi:hypothetical protein
MNTGVKTEYHGDLVLNRQLDVERAFIRQASIADATLNASYDRLRGHSMAAVARTTLRLQ